MDKQERRRQLEERLDCEMRATTLKITNRKNRQKGQPEIKYEESLAKDIQAGKLTQEKAKRILSLIYDESPSHYGGQSEASNAVGQEHNKAVEEAAAALQKLLHGQNE